MAFDEKLAGRIRTLLADERDVTEKRMFGGLAFLIGGNMAVVARGRGGLMVRVDPDDTDSILAEPGVAAAEMRGRPMRGWVTVADVGYAKSADLRRWVGRGVAAARAAPRKSTKGEL
jgi:TfoX N-terminal domain